MQAFPFDNSYARLPEHFYRHYPPAEVYRPKLIQLNRELADELGLHLEGLDDETLAAIFAGNQVPEGAEPLAMAYAGHQFGNPVPQLGDGRALLLGEVVDSHGRRRDIQLKGAGATPFSRGGDGRAPLGPVIREYLVSEAMHALGVPTTRSLAMVTTGETVFRDRALPGAVLTRVASSHIRVGTFEYFAMRSDHDAVRTLAEHAIERHYPEIAREVDNPALRYWELLRAVARQQVALVADWMSVGFIHGVMNTDNTTIAGETIDYGPCAFMDHYHPETVFSSIDTGGRYAYRMQPLIIQWNMARFAECLLPLLGDDKDKVVEDAQAMLQQMQGWYDDAWLERFRAKLGLWSTEDEDRQLAEDLLQTMTDNRVDFTTLFRTLCEAAGDDKALEQARQLFGDTGAWDDWAGRWRQRLTRDSTGPDERRRLMRATNPSVIPRNHRIEQVIASAVDSEDFSDFHRLRAILAEPFADHPEQHDWLAPPTPEERVTATFCGT